MNISAFHLVALLKQLNPLGFVLIIALIVNCSVVRAVEIHYWTPFSGGDGRPMLNLVNRFNRSQDEIQVKMINIPWEEYYPRLMNVLSAGDAPALVVVHGSRLPEFVRKHLLADLTLLAGEEGIIWSDFADGPLETTILDGRHYAVPLDSHSLVFFYNEFLLAQAGLLDSKGRPRIEPGSEGFLNFLRQLKAALPTDTSAFGSPTDNVYPFWIWYAIYSQQKGAGKYIDGNRAAFNNEQARIAAEVLLQMQKEELWPNLIHDKKGYNLFKFGYAATMFGGVWAAWNFEENPDLNFGASQIPVLFDESATWGDSHVLAVPVKVSKKSAEAAVRFAKWLVNNSAGWVLAGHIPAKKSVLSTSEYKELPQRSAYADSIRQVNNYPKHALLWKCNEVMTDVFIRMLDGELSSVEALNLAESRINQILKEEAAVYGQVSLISAEYPPYFGRNLRKGGFISEIVVEAIQNSWLSNQN